LVYNSLEEISLSYNGGKDCLVLLILLLSSLHTHSTLPSSFPLPPALQSVYIISPHPFPEVDSFVDTTLLDYHLNLARYAKPMKEAFQQYLEEMPAVKAILVGTRRTDPHGRDLTHFDVTDHGWPTFMRVHPVIDWHYVEIWTVCCPLLLRDGIGVLTGNLIVYTPLGDSILYAL
jgi:FAD synthetase